MAIEPITISAFQQTGRVTEIDTVTGKVFCSSNLDFSAAASYLIDFSVQSQGQTFGTPRTMFLDNGSNPNTVEILVQGTDQFFTVPAYSTGFYSLDATNASRVSLITDGGATDQCTVTFYNYERAPVVWYSFGAFNSNVPIKTYGTMDEGDDVATEPFKEPVYFGGIDRATGEFRGIAVDAQGRLDFASTITIGAVTIADGADVALGSTTDAAITNPVTNGTLIAFTRGILTGINLSVTALGNLLTQLTAAAVSLVNIDNDTTTIATNTARSTNGTLSNVVSAAADTLILAANANAKSRSVYNDSTQILYLTLDTTAASLTNYTVQLQAGGYYETEIYTGEIRGIWAAANGNARVTETA